MGEMEARRELGEKEHRRTDPLDRRTGRCSRDPDEPRDGLAAQGRARGSASTSCASTAPCASCPEECRTVASFEGDQLNLETTEQRHVDAVRPDLVSDLWLDRLARALAPIRDVSTEDLSSALPAASRLLDVLRLHEPDAGRWCAAGRARGAPPGP